MVGETDLEWRELCDPCECGAACWRRRALGERLSYGVGVSTSCLSRCGVARGRRAGEGEGQVGVCAEDFTDASFSICFGGGNRLASVHGANTTRNSNSNSTNSD